MAGELTYPVLAVPDLADAVAFYEALGFEQRMRQERPNPYAVVGLEDMRIHLAGVAALDPSTSLGNVIVVVPDADALYARFAAGFRARFGRLPKTGAPRILRPRKKAGTVAGFSVVDPDPAPERRRAVRRPMPGTTKGASRRPSRRVG